MVGSWLPVFCSAHVRSLGKANSSEKGPLSNCTGLTSEGHLVGMVCTYSMGLRCTVNSFNANTKHSLGPKSVSKPGHLLFDALTSEDTDESKLVELC